MHYALYKIGVKQTLDHILILQFHSSMFHMQVPYWLTYDFPPEVSEKLRHEWGSDCKGQAQKW